jgi:hypothetical protein
MFVLQARDGFEATKWMHAIRCPTDVQSKLLVSRQLDRGALFARTTAQLERTVHRPRGGAEDLLTAASDAVAAKSARQQGPLRPTLEPTLLPEIFCFGDR